MTKNKQKWKYDDPWVTPEGNQDVGRLARLKYVPGHGFYNFKEPQEIFVYVWNIGHSEGIPSNKGLPAGTICLLLHHVRDRWVILVGEQQWHVDEEVIELIE
jgi:hypothetical protein